MTKLSQDREHHNKLQREYKERNPWYTHYTNARSRCVYGL